jgi:FkbM family methyltransferase
VLRRLWKPWFVRRPSQILRRVRAAVAPAPPGYQPIPTSWGMPIVADASRTIGRSILTTGVHDLAVSELLARLIDDGATVLDAGANVGYMTVLAAVAAGPEGRVIAFEPHPRLFDILRQNVESAGRRHAIARPELHNQALGASTGSARLLVPADFGANAGVARIASDDAAATIVVNMTTLDEALGAEPVSVLKMDVEGHELAVLEGCRAALSAGRIRHIVFEDHAMGNSEVARLLGQHGYTIRALGWRSDRLIVDPVDGGRRSASYEAPSFLATLDVADVERRVRRRGWVVLSGRFARRRMR